MSRKRSHSLARLVLLSLTLASLASCGVVVRQAHSAYQKISAGSLVYPGRVAPLTDKEQIWAKVAWRYFVNNTNADTGLVGSVDRYPATTVWQMGDYLLALVSARELKLIDQMEFDRRLSRLFRFLNKMDLAGDALPNKVYNTQKGIMLNLNSQAGESGWSAVDVARLMVGLRLLGDRYPEYQEYLDKVILRWNFCGLLDQEGQLYRSTLINGQWVTQQEGRLGYEEYAAQGLSLWGFRPYKAGLQSPLTLVNMEGMTLRIDGRDPREDKAGSPLVSYPYWLMGLEFGWKPMSAYNPPGSDRQGGSLAGMAEDIYRVQERRWYNRKIYTARTDHNLSGPPYLLQDAIFANGNAWNTVSEDGSWYPHLSLVATRAVFGMWVLWDTPYTDALMKITETLYDKDRGWFEGRYEASGAHEEGITLTTNAMVLEALLYKSGGPLFRGEVEPEYYRNVLARFFDRPGQGFPPERASCRAEES